MVSWTTLVKTELLLLFIAAAAQAVAFWPGSFDINDSLPLALESFVYYGVLRIGGQLVLSTAGLLDRRGYTDLFTSLLVAVGALVAYSPPMSKKDFLHSVKAVMGRTPAILLSRALQEGRKQELQFMLTWGWRLLLLSLCARGLHVVWETLCCRARLSTLYKVRQMTIPSPSLKESSASDSPGDGASPEGGEK